MNGCYLQSLQGKRLSPQIPQLFPWLLARYWHDSAPTEIFPVTKEKPLSYVRKVPFGHSHVVMLFWDAEKCHFLLGSVGEDAPSQQSSDCFSTSTSPELHSEFWVLFPRKSCFWMGARGVLAGAQQGTWQGEDRGRRGLRRSS